MVFKLADSTGRLLGRSVVGCVPGSCLRCVPKRIRLSTHKSCNGVVLEHPNPTIASQLGPCGDKRPRRSEEFSWRTAGRGRGGPVRQSRGGRRGCVDCRSRGVPKRAASLRASPRLRHAGGSRSRMVPESTRPTARAAATLRAGPSGRVLPATRTGRGPSGTRHGHR
jgi:hypothetical protein